MSKIDEKLRKLGFEQLKDDPENKYGVSYIRSNKRFEYIHRVDIVHKANGKHLILSYENNVNSDMYNNVVGLTYNELKLFMAKYREMKRKYRWKYITKGSYYETP